MLYGDGIHDDTIALQALLDRYGIVTIDQPGEYLVSRTLIIHSNTKFVLSPGVDAPPWVNEATIGQLIERNIDR